MLLRQLLTAVTNGAGKPGNFLMLGEDKRCGTVLELR